LLARYGPYSPRSKVARVGLACGAPFPAAGGACADVGTALDTDQATSTATTICRLRPAGAAFRNIVRGILLFPFCTPDQPTGTPMSRRSRHERDRTVRCSILELVGRWSNPREAYPRADGPAQVAAGGAFRIRNMSFPLVPSSSEHAANHWPGLPPLRRAAPALFAGIARSRRFAKPKSTSVGSPPSEKTTFVGLASR